MFNNERTNGIYNLLEECINIVNNIEDIWSPYFDNMSALCVQLDYLFNVCRYQEIYRKNLKLYRMGMRGLYDYNHIISCINEGVTIEYFVQRLEG